MKKSRTKFKSSENNTHIVSLYLIFVGIILFAAGIMFTAKAEQSDITASFGGSSSLSDLNTSTLPAQSSLSAGSTSYVPVIFGPQHITYGYPVVFVSRQIPGQGSQYYPQGGSLPGVGPYTRFQVASPGKLMIREPNGNFRTLVNGANPSPASLNLIDVNAPDVSYDGKKIVFAGLPAGQYYGGPRPNIGAWRIYMINVDGTGLHQVTFSDQDTLPMPQFNNEAHWKKYDDTDPVWLPDGRIVFSSTRWPSLGMYQDARTTNLYVVNADGSNLHRITAERNGADRPLVDPLTGKIVYSRWWRNFRNASNNLRTVTDPLGGYRQYNGLVAESQQNQLGAVPGADLIRNSWMLATINPDGTGLAQWGGVSGISYDSFMNQAYGGSFAPDGSLLTSFFPMVNLTEAAGFGGIRRFERGPNGYTPIIGITEDVGQLVSSNPPSHHVFKGAYAAEPEVLPDGRVIISWAPNTNQDYGLYVINPDGSDRKLLYNNPGTSELRVRLVRPRPLPLIIPDQVTAVASLLPPLAQGPYDIDGSFTFGALNVYFNAPVDVNIASAMPVGSAGTIRFFIDHQRNSGPNFREGIDWPILLDEVPVNPDGSVSVISPANVPLFEQIRTPQPSYTVPLAGTDQQLMQQGAAHVAGLNFGRPGTVARCVGCHAGHSMIPVPANDADAKWTNLAPGASVAVSSSSSNTYSRAVVDRFAKQIFAHNRLSYWLSKSGLASNAQWVQLTFPVPVTVRTVRLYDIVAASGWNVNVLNTTVRLYSDSAATNQVAVQSSGALSESGTDVSFSDVSARVVRIEFNSVAGGLAGLAEVEVIARGE